MKNVLIGVLIAVGLIGVIAVFSSLLIDERGPRSSDLVAPTIVGPPPAAKADTPTTADPGEPSDQALIFAVIDNLRGKVMLDVDHHKTPAQLDCEATKIQVLRTWAKTIADKRVRAQYERFLDYADRQIAESRAPEEFDQHLAEERQTKLDLIAGTKLAPTLPQVPDVECASPNATVKSSGPALAGSVTIQGFSNIPASKHH